MIMAEMLQLDITSTLQQHYHVIRRNGLKPREDTLLPWEDTLLPWEDTLLPWKDTLLPWEDTLLPLQLIAECIPDAAYD